MSTTPKTISESDYSKEHPEQDPAEGSLETVNHDLVQETESEAAHKPGDANKEVARDI